MENRARPGTSKRYAIQIDRAAQVFDGLPPEVRRLLRLCDGSRSLRQLRTDSGMSPALFARVLYRLVTLGLVGAAPDPRPDRRIAHERAMEWTRDLGRPLAVPERAREAEMAFDKTMEIQLPLEDTLPFERIEERAFSTDEEAFFAQTIDHLLEPEERVLSLDLH
jgi:hypothetical protein